ncbi:tyrosine-type recombinase/integrase [Rudaeicoccus suwonensis]|uniref:tyrosine-type recombinase/integrase n=1 Tax=Rudaeicoccus suwonensis TaxID=657409 RepID=UPI0011A088C9|nr:tyrosine-type recombinase/integrase [Rudaeicoccus suwonensis]
MSDALTVEELRSLLLSWQLSLRADRKSPQTVKSYAEGVTQYLAYAEAGSRDPLARDTLRGFVTSILDSGREASTARARQLAVRRFTAWLDDEDELGGQPDPFVSVKAPKLDTKVIEPLTDEQLKALLKACQSPPGADRSIKLRHQRDEAILRLMLETGMRAGEVVALEVNDVDLAAGMATVRRGKGGKGRVVPFGPNTGQAIDRYLRTRRGHLLAATSADLWLGDRGKRFSYDALHKTLGIRAEAAGIVGFHPHRMRHTAAHRWLAAGGSEGGLMAVAGWTRPDMLMRYTKAQAASRAAEEAKRLGLGEL